MPDLMMFQLTSKMNAIESISLNYFKAAKVDLALNIINKGAYSLKANKK